MNSHTATRMIILKHECNKPPTSFKKNFGGSPLSTRNEFTSIGICNGVDHTSRPASSPLYLYQTTQEPQAFIARLVQSPLPGKSFSLSTCGTLS